MRKPQMTALSRLTSGHAMRNFEPVSDTRRAVSHAYRSGLLSSPKRRFIFHIIQRIQLFMWTNRGFQSDRHWCYLRLRFEGGHPLAPNIRPPHHCSSIFVPPSTGSLSTHDPHTLCRSPVLRAPQSHRGHAPFRRAPSKAAGGKALSGRAGIGGLGERH